MIKAIACVVLIIGLLNFAKEAPDLFKKLFSTDGLFSGIDLNPHGQIKRNLQNAGSTIKTGANFVKGVGNGIAAPFKGAATVGKAISGGIAGARAGADAGGFLGGARGLVAGGKAGVASKLGMAGTAGGYAGGFAGAISASQKQSFDTSKSQYDTMFNAMMKSKEKTIQEKKDAKKAVEAEYLNNINKYRQDHAQQYLQQAQASGAVNTALNNIIQQEAARTGRSAADLRNDTAYMDKAQKAAQARVAADVDKRIREEAEAMYKGGRDARISALDNEIAKAKSEALDMPTAQRAMAELVASKDKWGNTIHGDYNDAFNKKMSGVKDADLAAAINAGLQSALGSNLTYAGDKSNATINDADVTRLMGSINSLSSQSNLSEDDMKKLTNQKIALATIMDNMNGAMSDVSRNITLASTADSTYHPKPESGDKK